MAFKGGTEIKVGIFVFLGILALFYLTVKLAQEALTPKDAYKIYALFDDIAGLSRGAKVVIAGVPVGKVSEINLTSEGKAKVTLLIYKRYKIQKDAKAIIRTFGALGDKYIEIKPGKSQQYLSENSTIFNTQSPIELDQILANVGPTIEGLKELFGSEETQQNFKELVRSIKEASENFKIIAQRIERSQGTLGKLISDDTLYVELKKTIVNLKDFSAKLKEGRGTLGRLIEDETLYENLKSISESLNKIAQRIEKGQGTLGKLVYDDTLYKNLTSTVNNLNKIAQKIERGEGTLGKLINDDTLYVELKRTLQSVNRAAVGIEEQVPITIMGTVAGAAMQ